MATRPALVDTQKCLGAILEAERLAYVRGGLVNADLSENNILTGGKRVWLIDWPQAVGGTHPNALAASDCLRR